eukprot:s2728_g7.t1
MQPNDKADGLSRLKTLNVLAAGELRMALEGYGSKEGLAAACMLLEEAIAETLEAGNLEEDAPKELELVPDGPAITIGRSSKTSFQVVCIGASNTHVELRLLGANDLRVRDVSSNGTGLQDPTLTSGKHGKLKKDQLL